MAQADDAVLSAALAGYAGWLGHAAAARAPRWVTRLQMNADELARFQAAALPVAPAYVAAPVVPVVPPWPMAAPVPVADEGRAQHAWQAARAQSLRAFTHWPEQLAPAGAGYLQGLPVAVKDMIGVAGLPCTGGSASSSLDPLVEDAAAVAALRAQGAVVIGLTNLHELAFGASSDNPVYGRVINPRAPQCIPGGSSGGSAAAVAAGIVDVALATDTGGSVRIPAACCGVVGFKPSFDAVPRTGVLDIAASLDHVGPIGRRVADCAQAFAALTGLVGSPQLPTALPLGLRVSTLQGYFTEPLAPAVAQALASAETALRQAGAVLQPGELPMADLASAIYFVTVSCEAAAALGERLQQRPEGLGEDVRVRLEMANFLPGHWYVKAQRLRTCLARELDALLAEADILICPTMRAPAPLVGATQVTIGPRDYPLHTAVSNLTLPFSLAGLPALSLPWGQTEDGVPLSVQLVAARGNDWQLLAVAQVLEALAPA